MHPKIFILLGSIRKGSDPRKFPVETRRKFRWMVGKTRRKWGLFLFIRQLFVPNYHCFVLCYACSVSIWNCLPNSVADALFKARLDNFRSHQAGKFDFTAEITGIGNRSEKVIKKVIMKYCGEGVWLTTVRMWVQLPAVRENPTHYILPYYTSFLKCFSLKYCLHV